jgi:queuine tRNA-ribosyltransferase
VAGWAACTIHALGRPILTDSGGFQVMSLSKIRKLTEQGVTFQSHIDGSAHELSPERSMEIQRLLGSDIQMQLDECIAPGGEGGDGARHGAVAALGRAQQGGLRHQRGPGQALFGIVQGGDDAELRLALGGGAEVAMALPGYAVGGLAVGEAAGADVPHARFRSRPSCRRTSRAT